MDAQPQRSRCELPPISRAEPLAMSLAATSVAEAVRKQQAPAEMLFQPYKLGPLTLPHRIVMAPLTRSRARPPGTGPTSLTACYYAQRPSAPPILTQPPQV